MTGQPFFGNAKNFNDDYRGWFVGHFIEGYSDLLKTNAVEVKWDELAAGETRPAWADGASVTTLSILVRGKFILSFADREYVLEHAGDFCIWGDGVGHTWRAIADSLVITVRWPSRE